jgi:di/tricarboxylate transporter
VTTDQAIIFALLGLTLLLFITGRWRYDLVALVTLVLATLFGLVPADEAFSGFGHPAVITVAAVLVVSRGLQGSGMVEVLAQWLGKASSNPTVQVLLMTGVVALLSAFMNNVGALALLMPVAVRLARKSQRSPSYLLMPLAFGSLLGGLVTLTGTPPNIIIATYRAEVGVEPFRMFDFTPVGLGVAVAGVLFVGLLGWRLTPQRKGQAEAEELLNVQDYMTEVRVPTGARAAGMLVRDLEDGDEGTTRVLSVIRNEQRLAAPSGFLSVQEGDVLIVQGDSDALQSLIESTGVELVTDVQVSSKELGSEDVSVVEAVVAPRASAVGRSAQRLRLRGRYGVNLLAMARQGARLRDRLGELAFAAGDVALLQGPSTLLADAMADLGLLPLAEREVRLGQQRRLVMGLAIISGTVAAAATGLLEVQIAFLLGAMAMVLVGLVALREAYQSVDWPIIVLLGALIPVGGALETTGGAQLVADGLVSLSGGLAPWLVLLVILVGTMFLSDLVNNAAAAVLMAPIAIFVASGLGASPDPFLMVVAIGASSAFLTPIGHQSNTLVMSPGGYLFRDYWRMGLPLEVLIVAVTIPLVLLVWPL